MKDRKTTAAIYCRISSDKTGAGLGVQRQEQDCRDLAAARGWEVASVLIDNDITAYSGKRRPGYEALLQSIESGAVDLVITWSHDRLHRRPTELEKYIDVCDRARVDTYTIKAGHFDLSTPSGRAVARTLAAWAAYEVETSTARVRAAKMQAAKSGRWSGGQRPYAYEADGVTVREEEAVILRGMCQAVIDGASFRSVAIDLNKREIKTATGKGWNALKVRNLLTRKRNVGIREHLDHDYPAEWPAVVDQAMWDELQDAINTHRSLYKQRGPFRKHLLKGFAYCGACDNQMNVNSKQGRDGSYKPSYRCMKHHDERGRVGCGGVSRMVAPVDDLVTEAVLFRLESPDMTRAMQELDEENPRVRELLEAQRAQEARLRDLVEDYSTGLLTRSELASAKLSAQQRLDDLGRQIGAATAHSAFRRLPVGETVRKAWAEGSLEWRRQVLALLIDKVYIDPRTPGAKQVKWGRYVFDPDLIRITWLV
jgi:site-specific DNA recombinase